MIDHALEFEAGKLPNVLQISILGDSSEQPFLAVTVVDFQIRHPVRNPLVFVPTEHSFPSPVVTRKEVEGNHAVSFSKS